MNEENNNASLSFAPSDASSGGLPVVGATVVLQGAHFLNRDSKDEDTGEEFSQPCFGINLVDYQTGTNYGYEGGPQSYSVGNSSDWVITADGDILPATPGNTFRDSSKFMIFMRELVSAGFPEERLKKGDISVINNAVVVMGEVPFLFGGEVQKRTDKRTGKEYDVKVVVPTLLAMLPEDYEKEAKKAGKKTGAAAGGKKAAGGAKKEAKKSEGSDMNDAELIAATVKAVSAVLDKSKEGNLPKASLMAQVMKHLLMEKADYRSDALAIIDKQFEELEEAALESGEWIVDEDIIQRVSS